MTDQLIFKGSFKNDQRNGHGFIDYGTYQSQVFY